MAPRHEFDGYGNDTLPSMAAVLGLTLVSIGLGVAIATIASAFLPRLWS